MEIQRVTRYLDSAMVEEAYRNGIFPMADPDLRLVTWHRPRRRAILPLDSFHVSRSLQRRLRRGGFEVTFDQDFGGVMAGCAQRSPTWISEEFRAVYGAMHRAGKAHSVEVWVDGALAGGGFGGHLGGAFFAESEFHRLPDICHGALLPLVGGLRAGGVL